MRKSFPIKSIPADHYLGMTVATNEEEGTDDVNFKSTQEQRWRHGRAAGRLPNKPHNAITW